MKNKIFGKCDTCIGITPCRISHEGKVICEYCTNEVTEFIFKAVVSDAKTLRKDSVVSR